MDAVARTGMPVATFDPRTAIGLQLQLSTSVGGADGGGCAVAFTVSNVAFY